MGRHWYDDGKLLHKQHTFSDFAACARHLVAEGWTTARPAGRPRAARAGGLLIGAVANQYPDLFGGLVADVPFVDALTSMLDASLPADRDRVRRVGRPRATRRPTTTSPATRRTRTSRPSTTRRSWRPRPSTTPGCSTSRRPSGSPACGPRATGTARLPAQDRDVGRSRRGLGPLPGLARPGVHQRLGPRPDGPGERSPAADPRLPRVRLRTQP